MAIAFLGFCVILQPNNLSIMRSSAEILIADDDSTVRLYLYKLLTIICALEGKEAVIYEAHDGKEALQMIDNFHDRLDFVISGVCMPEADGNKVASYAYLQGLPVILATATPSSIKPDIAPICHALINKPMDLHELKNAVMTLLLALNQESS